MSNRLSDKSVAWLANDENRSDTRALAREVQERRAAEATIMLALRESRELCVEYMNERNDAGAEVARLTAGKDGLPDGLTTRWLAAVLSDKVEARSSGTVALFDGLTSIEGIIAWWEQVERPLWLAPAPTDTDAEGAKP